MSGGSTGDDELIEIPYRSLSDAALAEKRRAVLRSLEEGTATITFDPKTQTTHIVHTDDLTRDVLNRDS